MAGPGSQPWIRGPSGAAPGHPPGRHGRRRGRRRGYPEWPVHDERDVEMVAAVVRSGHWGGFPEPGPLAAEFAARFASYQGATHGVAMANGTVTMEVALKALGIGWGDEVLVPALTFAATPYAAMAAGALPVFCDVDPLTLTIDPDLAAAAVTPRTRAIMPVHLGHQMADMDRLMEIARRHSLAVVEDCAHAHGQRWRDRGAGAFGEFGSFSHQSYKLLTAGEGGSLLCGDEELARRAHSLIDCGRPKDAAEKDYTFGANYRLSELQAALLLVALERFPDQQAERAANAAWFEKLAAGIPGVRLIPPDQRITRWSFYRYVVLIEPEAFAGAGNELVCDALEAEGVGAWVGYPPMSRYDLFQPSLSRLPVAVEHAERLDPARMSFPVAERLALQQTVYLDENVFRARRQGVEQWHGDPVVGDQRVGEQRLEGQRAVAAAGGRNGQALVGLHLLDQAEELRGQGIRRQRVDPVDPDRPQPREVVQADVPQLDAVRLDHELGGEPALEADRHVAQADGAVALVEQRLGDDPDRVGEVDQPGPGGGAAGRLLGDVEHHRHGPQRLGEPARPGGLLADAAELQRQRLVDAPLRLPADAKLDDHEVRAVQRLLEPPGQLQPAAEAGPREHAAGEAADHLQALLVGVEQHQLVHWQPLRAGGEALHQLWGVGAASPHHRDLQAHPRAPCPAYCGCYYSQVGLG